MRHIFSAAVFAALTAIFIATITLAPDSVSAHSKVDTTTPADGANIGNVPENVSLDFAKEIRLTKVVMTHMDHPPVDLDLSGLKSFSRKFRVPVVGMGNGPYRIEWRGLGKDGHAMQGSFTFNVN